MLFPQGLKLLPQRSKSVFTEIISLPNKGNKHIPDTIHLKKTASILSGGNELVSGGYDSKVFRNQNRSFLVPITASIGKQLQKSIPHSTVTVLIGSG